MLKKLSKEQIPKHIELAKKVILANKREIKRLITEKEARGSDFADTKK